jgi:serine/threonine protein kinase
MKPISDQAISRLQAAGALPDLSGTRYRLLERLGSGGMGSVYLVEDSVLARRVALKVLDVSDAAGELAARLFREARILAALEHPGIVPVHDAGTLADGRAFYAMKFVEGQRLDRLLEAPMALSARVRILQRICEAVAFAHARGIVHRDLKPENIMVGPFGEVLVMDWGIARILADGPANFAGPGAGSADARKTTARSVPTTAHGTVVGTPGYMAPEQSRGEVEQVGERADVYSLGALLRFLLSERSPGHAEPVVATGAAETGSRRLAKPPGTPAALAAIARKAMVTDPRERYSSAAEMGRDLARYLDGLSVSALPENYLQRTRRWAGRHRVAIMLVLTYLMARALLILWVPR